jgi:hypothetical protein
MADLDPMFWSKTFENSVQNYLTIPNAMSIIGITKTVGGMLFVNKFNATTPTDKTVEQYRKLKQLAQQLDMPIILELLTELYLARAELETRERLTKGLVYMLANSPWCKPLGLERLGKEMIEPQPRRQLVFRKISEAIIQLPLTWGACPHFSHFALLAPMDLLGLFGALLRQKFLRTRLQAFVPSVELYLQVFSILVETAEQNRAAELCRTNAQDSEHSAIWKSFLISSQRMARTRELYRKIERQAEAIGLPGILFLEIDDDIWLLSLELISGNLVDAYIALLKIAR